MAFGCITYPGSQGAEQQTVGVNRSGNNKKKAFNQPLVNVSFQALSVPPRPLLPNPEQALACALAWTL